MNIPSQSFDEAYQEVLEKYESQGIDVESLHGSDLKALEYEAYDQMKGKDISEILTDAAVIVWLAGMLLVGSMFLYTNLRFRRKILASRYDLDIRKDTLPVYVTGEIDTPCLFGLKHPAIYVTYEAADNPTLLRHTIAHEATHHRHGDHIWAVLRCVCLALHWYNPLVWWAAFLSQRDAELACDEATIQQLGEGERAEYGRTLIGMTCQKKSNVLITATTMTTSKSGIRERILLIAQKPKMAVYTLIAVLLIASIAVGCTFTGAKKDQAEAYTNLDDSLIEYAYEQLNKTTPKEDIHLIGGQYNYALVYHSGMGAGVNLYRYKLDGDQIQVMDHSDGDIAISGGLSVNHIVDGDKHIYFGTISDYHWMPEEDSRMPLDWRNLVFYDADGNQHFAIMNEYGYLCVMDSPMSDFWVVVQGGNVPLKMDKYLEQGYLIHESTWYSDWSTAEPTEMELIVTEPQGATIEVSGMGTLYAEADYDKVCIAVQPTSITTEGGDFTYIIPENQDVLLEYFQAAVALANKDLSWDNDLSRTGWWIVYQGRMWQVMTDGTLYSSAGTVAGEDAKELYAFCSAAVEEAGIVEPVHPADITDIKSATLYWNGVHTVTDEYALNKIENWFSNARDYVSVQCWFGAQLVLELENGETKTIAMATDSCAVWLSEGFVYGYGEITQDGITGNEEFYSLFATDVIYEAAKQGMDALSEYQVYMNWSRFANRYGAEETFALMDMIEQQAVASGNPSIAIGWIADGLDGAYTDYYAGILARIYESNKEDFAWACLGNATDEAEELTLSMLAYHWGVSVEEARATVETALPEK